MTVRSGKGDSGGPVFKNNGQENYTLVSVPSQKKRSSDFALSRSLDEQIARSTKTPCSCSFQ